MPTLRSTAFLMAADSAIASAALGPVVPTPLARVRLAALFGACDAAAVLVGATIWVNVMPTGLIGAAAVLVYGIPMLLLGSRLPVGRGSAMLLLPLVVSFDNVVVGRSLASGEAPAQAAMCLPVTGGLAFLGLTLGAHIGQWQRVSADRLAGAAVVFCSLVLLFI